MKKSDFFDVTIERDGYLIDLKQKAFEKGLDFVKNELLSFNEYLKELGYVHYRWS